MDCTDNIIFCKVEFYISQPRKSPKLTYNLTRQTLTVTGWGTVWYSSDQILTLFSKYSSCRMFEEEEAELS